MRKRHSFLPRAAMMLLVMMLTSVTAWATDISYLDAAGVQQSCTTYTTVESSTTNWDNAWYVVSNDVTISSRISVSGTVHLILCNGATLTAQEGIGVGSGSTFCVYAQSEDEATMGALVTTAKLGSNNAAIGSSGVNNAFGTIVINGGKITATNNSNCGAPIGGSYCSEEGTITINGGIVNATACDYSYCAGIGGGRSGSVSSITLNGGIITATGDAMFGGAGIGAGGDSDGGTMTITIGSGVTKIVATKGNISDCIGKRLGSTTSVSVVFKDGETTVEGDAKDAVFYDSEEGSVRQVRTKALNHHVLMGDDLKASIRVFPEYALAGETVTLTLGVAADLSTLRVNDGTSDLTLMDAGNRQYTFTMPAKDVTVTANVVQTYAFTLPVGMKLVNVTNAADGNGKYISGTVFTFKPEYGYVVSNVSDGTNTLVPDEYGVFTVTIENADINITATFERNSPIDMTGATDAFTVFDNDILIGSTDYAVTIANGASITLNNATFNGGIVCEGSATITLIGTNSTTGEHQKAGIQIGGSGTTLTINGDGALTANGGEESAGIGVNCVEIATEDVVGGNIVINGGNITANGGDYGAGIGTCGIGYMNSFYKFVVGDITIKGGSLKAVGGTDAYGIGSGYNDYDAVVEMGTITVYDGIDVVDASSIMNFGNVVYMHGEDDVTANKNDYFSIGENGKHCIIMPKDDTDYTITIADGIEHGTLSASDTAKFLDKVTVIVSSDLGYRFIRLIVKDGENNDVETEGNTFMMPKSNVTVSAVFEKGVHGTQEFKWLNVATNEEETIYDGVTTVNINMQGIPYYIHQNIFDEVYGYERDRCFRFDADEAGNYYDIPCLGGFGEFDESGAISHFHIPYDGETGYYDITLTDVGNGKWNVYIMKTVAQVDEVPEQTYTGSEIKPEPLVLAGSLDLKKDIDYVYSYENNVNTGTASVIVTFLDKYAWLGSVERRFKISPSVTDCGSAQILESENGKTVVFDATSAGELEFASDVTVNEVTVNRTFTAGKAVTVMMPFNYECNGTEGGKFYEFAGVAENNGQWIATMKEPGEGTNNVTTLTANTPYMFMPEGDTMLFPNINPIEGVTLNTTTNSKQTTMGDWTFKGVYEEKTWTAAEVGHDYGFAAVSGTSVDGTTEINPGDFVKIAAGAHIKPMRAYLTFTGATSPFAAPRRAAAEMPQNISVVLVNRDGSTTEIGASLVNSEERIVNSGAWYTINGMKLDKQPTTKGLYIHEGRKTVIK